MSDGSWGYRFVITVNGKKKNYRRVKDEFGNKYKTKRQALKAREAAIVDTKVKVNDEAQIQKIEQRTVRDIYLEYCQYGRMDRAYQTNQMTPLTGFECCQLDK
ncbi:MAG: hypothetical protein IKH87_05565 [Firmicutes bacterium]|nr:hypothetical protein [Bacillota bacterium]